MGKNTKWKNYFWAGTLAAALLVCRLALWRLPERTVAWAEDTVPKRVALTFDDGPYPNLTRQLLDGLRERGVKASFFVVGENAKAYPDVIEMMYEDGHLIGNHTYNHVQLDKISKEAAKEEIEATNQKIFEITGVYPAWLRPPYGEWRKNLDFYVEMFPVLWDVDTFFFLFCGRWIRLTGAVTAVNVFIKE